MSVDVKLDMKAFNKVLAEAMQKMTDDIFTSMAFEAKHYDAAKSMHGMTIAIKTQTKYVHQPEPEPEVPRIESGDRVIVLED